MTTLERIWCQALGLDEPNSGAGFLASGGESLRALWLKAEAERELGLVLDLSTILEARNYQELASAAYKAPMKATPSVELLLDDNAESLSFSQERLAFMHELAFASAAYHVCLALRMLGPLDPSRLRTALFAVCKDHDSLRLTLPLIGGQIVPLWNHTPAPQWREISLGAEVDDAKRQEALESCLSELANAPFDSTAGPLLRAALVGLRPDEHVLLLVAHHAVADQWSMDVLIHEVAMAWNLHGKLRAKATSARPPFRRYAAWHRSWYERERREIERVYWLERLRGTQPTALIEDFVRPPQQSFRGRRLTIELSASDILALRSYSQARSCTPAMVLLTALKLLLQRHCATDDVVVGMPVACRHHAGADRLVGSLVNTVVVRTVLDANSDFAFALLRVRDSLLGALERPDFPFEALVKELRLPRDTGRSPLFAVMFNVVDTVVPIPQFEGLAISRLEFDKQAAQFDLQITVDLRQSRIVSFEYASDVFAAETINSLSQQYLDLLRSTIRGKGVDFLEKPADAELRQLRDWGQGARQQRTGGTVTDLLDPALQRMGASIAVVSSSGALSYREVYDRSVLYASALRARGVSTGSSVGIYLTRRPELLAVILGVLRAGAAYVPLDPAFPVARLSFMVSNSSLALLIHDGDLPSDPLLPIDSRRVVSLAELGTCEAPQNDRSREAARAAPNNPAYVIYTSGSSGRPKGVVIPHLAVVNFLRSMQREPGLAINDRLLSVTTLNFDIAVLELLLPLYVGAQVVLASEEQASDGLALRHLIEANRITTMQATPSTWRLLLESGWSGSRDFKALVGGETLTRELASALLERCGEVWNMYGPTETTIWSSIHRVEKVNRTRVPIGRPIANTQIMVLDRAMEICPTGVPGEIYIAGDGLALGYLNSPELTAERFIENPWSRDRRTTRLYRTGDRGRWRADGQLEHLGRFDEQVKVRGYRIETGEVEATLLKYPEVRRAVVVARPLRVDDVRLVAYFVPATAGLDAGTLREFARSWLPDYMIPQHFIALPHIPLLPNGKVDRSRLPSPRLAALARGETVAPRTRIERIVWESWSQVLGHDRFGVEDDFFDVGGHSLLAIRLVALLRERLRVGCSLMTLLRNPTIERLAMALQKSEPAAGPVPILLNSSAASASIYCLSGIQLYTSFARRVSDLVRVFGLYLPEELADADADGVADSKPPADAVNRLADAYYRLVKEAQTEGPYFLAGFSFGGVLALEVASRLRAAGQEVPLLLILDSDVPGKGRPIARSTSSKLRAALRSLVMDSDSTHADPNSSRRLKRYREMMASHEPRPYDGPVLRIVSTEPPAWDGGGDWTSVLSNAQTVQVDCRHLEIVDRTGVERWIDVARVSLSKALTLSAAPTQIDAASMMAEPTPEGVPSSSLRQHR